MSEATPRGEMTCAEAGRRGGLAMRDRHDRDYYVTIGHRGGTTTAARFSPEHFARIGRRGGQISRRRPTPAPDRGAS